MPLGICIFVPISEHTAQNTKILLCLLCLIMASGPTSHRKTPPHQIQEPYSKLDLPRESCLHEAYRTPASVLPHRQATRPPQSPYPLWYWSSSVCRDPSSWALVD